MDRHKLNKMSKVKRRKHKKKDYQTYFERRIINSDNYLLFKLKGTSNLLYNF